MRIIFRGLLVGLTVFAASQDVAGATPSTQRIAVLLLSGRNNHNWQETTPKIMSILEESGQFTVKVEEQPEQLTAERLQSFQVILSNWNAFGSGPEVRWPLVAQESYVQFVKRGGGHVVVHAGSASFSDWKEYQQLSLATWKVGQTTHGRRHNFLVRIEDVEHPIAQELSDFTYFGELWERPGLQGDVTVLASARSPNLRDDRREPVAVSNTMGKGRCFTLLLGHDATEMNNLGYVSLLVRGTHWAATGEAPRQLSPVEHPNPQSLEGALK